MALNATAFSLTYGSPLITFAQIVADFNSVYNVFEPQDGLSGPETPLAPNEDTIYTLAVYDLAENDIIVTLPPWDADRYVVFSFMDPFGEVYLDLGTVNGSTPGDYLMRLPEEQDGISYGKAPASDPQYVADIVSPTTVGHISVRMLVKDKDSQDDLNYVLDLAQQCSMSEVPRYNNSKALTPLTDVIWPGISNRTTANINLTAQLAPQNPPWSITPAEAEYVGAQLAAAGIANGTYTPVPGVDLSAAQNMSDAAMEQAIRVGQHSLGGGWYEEIPVGLYGDAWAMRASKAFSMSHDEEIYVVNDYIRAVALEPNKAILFTFSSNPPALPYSAWSLTLYRTNYTFFDNDYEIYSLGDRNNLTHPDGSPVYGETDSDDTFQILVQDVSTPPPGNWSNNWLPAPSDGQIIHIFFWTFAQYD